MLVSIVNDTEVLDYLAYHGLTYSDFRLTGDVINFDIHSRCSVDDGAIEYHNVIKAYQSFVESGAKLGIYIDDLTIDEIGLVINFNLDVNEHGVLLIHELDEITRKRIIYSMESAPLVGALRLRMERLLDDWPEDSPYASIKFKRSLRSRVRKFIKGIIKR